MSGTHKVQKLERRRKKMKSNQKITLGLMAARVQSVPLAQADLYLLLVATLNPQIETSSTKKALTTEVFKKFSLS